ncbi:MAG: thermonuclease family protein [Chloroflexi bacterium]|nr:thermonuclease family protein [Chloroflexota bacterium]
MRVAYLLALVVLLTSCSGSVPGAAPNASPSAAKSAFAEARVVRVIDGDTIEVSIDGKNYTVRYIGIDTPETVDPRRAAEYYGKEASAKNKELVEGRTVRLEKDVSETDRYGRLLRYVYVGEAMINAELLRLGYAQASAYPPDVKYQDRFRELEREARAAGRGLWAVRPERTAPATKAPEAAPKESEVYYANCEAAKRAGATPLYRGQPGYRAALDGDGDGVACE